MRMNVYLVNLNRDIVKLGFMKAQLERLGVAYERVPAVDGRALSVDEKRAAVNGFRWWCAIGLPPRDAEIGCALSHAGIYRKMASGKIGNCACVIEDDVVLAGSFVAALKEVESWIGNEIPRVIMLSDRIGQFNHSTVQPFNRSTFQLSSFAYCTDAYILNSKAAASLLNENYPLQRPCDHWAKWVKRGSIELYHYLPTVARQDQERFGTSTQGGLTSVKDYPLLKWTIHKVCRAIGKTIDVVLG